MPEAEHQAPCRGPLLTCAQLQGLAGSVWREQEMLCLSLRHLPLLLPSQPVLGKETRVASASDGAAGQGDNDPQQRMSPKGNARLDPGSGEEQHPKRAEEEEKLEMHPNMKEVVPSKMHGKAGENGLRRSAPRKSLVEPPQPDSGAASDKGLSMDPQVGYGSSTLALGVGRPQMGETSLWCLECGKAFGQKTELEKHRLHHVGRCSYICSDCGRGSVAKSTLRGRGTGGNPYSHLGGRRRNLPLSGESGMQRKERKELSLQEKVQVLEMLEGPKVSQSELAKRFGVSQPQICRIIKNKERILAEWHKNAHPGRKRKLEDTSRSSSATLMQWFEHSCVASIPAKGTHLQGRAKASPGMSRKPELEWSLCGLTSFKARQKAAPGRPLAEKHKDGHLEEQHWERIILPSILNKYDPPNIYACGEAGVLFKATPEDLALENREEAKEQLTVLICTNLDASDKRDAVIIGRKEKPFGFQGVGVKELPVTYRANSRSWMTAAIFIEWLQTFNEEMKHQQRRVVLFLAPSAAHPRAELSNIQMVFIPPGPSQAHPLEQGVIQAFKGLYRRRILTRLLVRLNSNAFAATSRFPQHLTLLDAAHTIIQAWADVPPQTVTSSFHAAGFAWSPPIPAPPADLVQALGFRGQEHFEQCVWVDEELECLGEQEEGAAGIRERPQCPEPVGVTAEEEEEADNCPSKAEVLESLAKLRRYFECHSVSPTVFQTFYQLEDLVYGMSLEDMQALKVEAHSKE